MNNFFKASACFASASVLRLPQPATGVTQDVLDKARARGEKVVLIGVRELGPTVSIGASWALVEGATEVVLDVTEYVPSSPMHRTFAVHWRSGGPGVLKGVAGLPQDMQAALAAALQPAAK